MKISKYTLIVALLCSSLAAVAEPEPGADKIALANQMLELWPVEQKPIAMVTVTGNHVTEQASRAVFGRLPDDKYEAAMLDVGSDVDAYLDEVTPIVSENAGRVKFSMLLPFLLENFSVAELDELVSFLESPVTKKFKRLAPEMQTRYEAQVAEVSGDAVKPRLDALTAKINETLTVAIQPQ